MATLNCTRVLVHSVYTRTIWGAKQPQGHSPSLAAGSRQGAEQEQNSSGREQNRSRAVGGTGTAGHKCEWKRPLVKTIIGTQYQVWVHNIEHIAAACTKLLVACIKGSLYKTGHYKTWTLDYGLDYGLGFKNAPVSFTVIGTFYEGVCTTSYLQQVCCPAAIHSLLLTLYL